MAEKWPEGPYYVTSDGLTVCSSATDDELAAVFDCEDATVSTTNEQAVAMAHLFAASPDMAAALEPFAAFIDAFEARPLRGADDRIYSLHGEHHITYSHMRAARAALSRARGEMK